MTLFQNQNLPDTDISTQPDIRIAQYRSSPKSDINFFSLSLKYSNFYHLKVLYIYACPVATMVCLT